ncbi:dipeptidase [Salinarimonas ramus]|uniref:Membrane dipeptidase n=1 Tax=Salinarimonas ramus TaxID=690164 RepID=A0A917QA39_9HYPH|nr:dipeptidase [Salinarimonas ramus]GGK37497.1 membrane dipeptidase [Salinarimonas ramus]
MPTRPVPVFDGHNDALLRLLRTAHPRPEDGFLAGEPLCHLDLPRARAGSFAGGLFAIYVPDPHAAGAEIDAMMARPRYDVPLPPALEPGYARDVTLAMLAILLRLERASDGALAICRSAAEIEAAMARRSIAAVAHLEGAEAIGPDLRMLDVLHAAGLRSLGPVWSRPTIFGEGVPFRFPSGPDIGRGLTPAGEALVRACNRLRIMVDLSHLNERGFWDVARISTAPLVATHSNANAVCHHARNLTDAQLVRIGETRGMVGLNFATSFIRPDGRRDPATPLSMMVDHIDHLVAKVGIDGVGLGSDFDGATVPDAIGDAGGLQALVEALRGRGYDGEALEKLCYRNWIRVLRETWGG